MIVSKQSQDGTQDGTCTSILTLLGKGHQENLHETYQCRMHSRKLLREDVRNM